MPVRDATSIGNPAGLLVIGYGNTLRSDDGVGPRVAEAIETLALPEVSVISCRQLAPEFAEPIARAARVVFVDAAVDCTELQMREMQPAQTAQIIAHAPDPKTMLALARDVFGHCPLAWWLTIPVSNIDIGETLTETGERGFEGAVAKIIALAKNEARQT